MEDSFLTIASETRTEIKVKGSRFIGDTFRVSSIDEAGESLTAVRKKEYQATHHCYAYVVGLPPDQEFKYSDDGEPNGTAGAPIHDVICGRELTNCLVVVTRYFGGTKLGTGGLVRAYSEAAKAVLDRSGRKENFVVRRFRFRFDFSVYDLWQKQLRGLEAQVEDSAFADQVTLIVSIRRSRAERMLAAFTELTSGRGEVEEIT
jgi:uncharacterized YigZ family protein